MGKHRQAEEKLAILKRHLIERISVADICDQEQIAPSAFYRWQQELFDHGASCFNQGKQRQARTQEQTKIAELEHQIQAHERKLSEKNEVIAELLTEHTQLKKNIGAI